MQTLHVEMSLLASAACVLLASVSIAGALSRLLHRTLRAREVVPAILLALLVALPCLLSFRLFAPTVSLGSILPGIPPSTAADQHDHQRNDAVLQFLPWELEVRRAFRQGHLPLWSDALGGGSDLWSNLQAQTLSPIAWLARPLPIQHFLLAEEMAKVTLGFLGAIVLATVLGIRRPWSLFGAASFALGGAVSPWVVFPHSSAVVWAPWVSAGIVVLTRRAHRSAIVATALATAALMLGGHPEVAVSGVALAAILGVSLQRRRRGLLRSLAAPALAGILGCLLASVQWIPLVATAQGSQRANDQRQETVQATGWFEGDHQRYLSGLLHPHPDLDGAVSPNPLSGARPGWSYPATVYLGISGLFGLSLLATRRPPRRFWPLLAFGGLTLLGLADFAPLETMLRSTPGLRLVEDSRFVPVGLLALSVCSAFGLQQVVRLESRRRHALALGATATASTLAGPPGFVLAGWAGLAAATTRPGRGSRGWIAVVAVVDLVGFAWFNQPRGRPGEFYSGSPLMDRLQAEQTVPGGPWRAVGHDFLAYPGVLSVYRVEDIRPHNPLAPQNQLDVLGAAFGYRPTSNAYFSAVRHLEHPLACFLGVRSILTNRYLPAIPGMERIDHDESPPFVLLRNACALPRWFFPAAVERVERQRILGWITAMRDPWTVAMEPDASVPIELNPRRDPVHIETTRPGYARLAFAPAPEASLLASSIPAAAGWRAFANEQRLATVTVNGAFLGVVVPRDVDRVEVRFEPPGFRWGAALATVAAACLLAIAFGRRGGRRVHAG
ncbi:MAG: YfhO family protein [Holophagales bacterium]|nr:MAG: YfhO family protein [Holophagales bacterium]